MRPRRPLAPAWVLVVDGGTEFPLNARNVIGRKPVPSQRDQGAHTIKLVDPERTLSKTHARLELEQDELWVTDLGSTNGTFIVVADEEEETECLPDERYRVPPDAVVHFGEIAVQAVRNPPRG